MSSPIYAGGAVLDAAVGAAITFAALADATTLACSTLCHDATHSRSGIGTKSRSVEMLGFEPRFTDRR